MKTCCTQLSHLSSLLSLYDNFIYCLDRIASPAQLARCIASLEFLRSVPKKRLFLLSDTAASTRDDLAMHLRQDCSFPVASAAVYTGGYIAASYLRSHYPAVQTVYYMGPEGMRKELSARGYKPIGAEDNASAIVDQRKVLAEAKARHIDAVLVGLDEQFTAYKIFMASFAVGLGARFLVTSREISFTSPSGVTLPGAGAIVTGVEVSTGKFAELVGRPGPVPYQVILQENQLEGAEKPRTVVLGGGLDVLGAAEAGLDSCLVYGEVDAKAITAPKYCCKI